MKKTLLIFSILCLVSLSAFSQTKVLYYCDFSPTNDQIYNALDNLACDVTYVYNDADFQTEIASPENYDIAIYYPQGNTPDSISVAALANFINTYGKTGMYFDWTQDNLLSLPLGVDYTGNIDDQASLNVTDATLSAGLPANPVPLSNVSGWGFYTFGLIPVAGTSMAVYNPGSSEDAIILSMSGHLITFGFYNDAIPSPELFENAILMLSPKIFTTPFAGTWCEGETLDVSYTLFSAYNPGNIFYAQLSDENGSFASPDTIGSLASTTADTISCTLPTGINPGNLYRIRVVSSDPAVIGSENGNDLTINTAPRLLCADTTVVNDPGVCGANVNYVVNVSGVPAPTLSYDPIAPGGSFPLGTTTVQVIANNICGNDTCYFNVTVNDTESPVITCPTDINTSNDPGVCGATVNYPQPVVTDNCNTFSIPGYTYLGIFNNHRYFLSNLATDFDSANAAAIALGGHLVYINSADENTFLTSSGSDFWAGAVQDIFSPLYSEPNGGWEWLDGSEITYTNWISGEPNNTGGNENYINVWVSGLWNDLPSSWIIHYIVEFDDVIQTAGLPSGSLFPIGTTTNTFLATDASGNTNTCSFDVTVTDDEAPAIACLPDQTVNTDSGECTYVIENSTQIVTTTYNISLSDLFNLTEVCGGGSYYNWSSWPAGFDWTDTGNGTVTDVQLQFSVGVECSGGYLHSTQLNGNNEGGFATSNWCLCNAPSNPDHIVTLNLNPSNYVVGGLNSFRILDYPNSWGLIPDALLSGYYAQVTVTYNKIVSFDPAFSDNCPGAFISYVLSGATTGTDTASLDGVILNEGLTNIVWTATDAYGNTNSCSFDITVEDKELPSITCPSDVNQTADSGLCEASVTIGPPTVDDNCGVDYYMNNYNGTADASDIYPVDTTYVTWTVFDIHGNTNTCIQTVIITDDEVPSITCAPDQTQTNDPGMCGAYVTVLPPATADNCAVNYFSNNYTGTADASAYYPVDTTVVTWTVYDVHGNFNTCLQTIIVTDDEPPVISCPFAPYGAFRPADPGMCYATVTVPTPNTWDNCDVDYFINDFTGTSNASEQYPVGITTINWTIFDIHGNSSTCIDYVSVIDNQPPIASTTDITIYLNSNGFASISASDVNSGSYDNCAITNMTLSKYIFGCENVGANTITFTAYDAAGNIGTAMVTVTVIDNIPPVIFCNNITVALDPTGNITITPEQMFYGGYDACGLNVMSVLPNTFTCADVGVNSVILSVTDLNGNTGTCSGTVTIVDNTPPVAVCKDIYVPLNFMGYADITAADIDNGSSDACGISSMTVTPSHFTCANIGNNNVTLTVTDNNGNVSTCIAVVTFDDVTPPLSFCKDITIQLDSTGNADITGFMLDNGSYDMCGISTYVPNITHFTCSHIGDNTVILTVTDFGGNQAYCMSTVTVEDYIPPVAVCKNITVPLDISGFTVITASQVNDNSYDACGIHSLTVSPQYFTCSEVGENNVTLTVTDVNGNVSSCTAIVTVEDITPPEAFCQNLTMLLDATGNLTITASQVDVGSFDECGIDNMEVSPTQFSCDNVGANTITLTVTDMSGNSSTCNATLTVLDLTPPVVNCQNITLELDSTGNATITAADITTGSSDACGVASMIVTPNTFTCANVGTNNVLLSVTDENGNISTCQSIVTVEDNMLPAALCNNITVELDEYGSATITEDQINNGSYDNCGIASIVLDDYDFNCYDIELTQPNDFALNFDGIDDYLQSGTTNAIKVLPLTIEAWVKPEIRSEITNLYPSNVISNDIPGQYGHGFGANINSQLNQITVEYEDGFITINNAGLIANTWQHIAVVYTPGNVKTYLNGVLKDNTNYIQAPLNGGNYLWVGKYNDDNSVYGTRRFYKGQIDELRVWQRGLSQSEIFANMNLTLTGNESELSLYYPIENGSGTVVTDVLGGASSTLVSMDAAMAWVSPGAPVQQEPIANNTVMMTVTDVNGNVSTCVSQITVIDNVAPIALCQNITVQLDATGNAEITPSQIDDGSSDACGIASLTVEPSVFTCDNVGLNNVILTVTDVNGNVSTCTAEVTIEDNIPPVAICQNITVGLDNTGHASITANDIDNGSGDACGITMTVSPNTFICDNVGANTVTLTVTDANNNISTCTALITVVDNTPPQVLCQNISIYLNSSGHAAIIPEDIDNGSNDACGIASLGVFPNEFICSNAGANFVTLTATDVNGNISSCIAVVTVLDTIKPIITCPGNIYTNSVPGTCNISGIILGFPTYTDNCIISSVENNELAVYQVGTTLVTWTISDVFGNVTTCIQTVYVESAPLAVNDTAITAESTPVLIPILANDLDCDNNLNPSSIIITVVPGHGTITIDYINGTVTYTPDFLFTGMDQFNYQICDSTGLCSEAMVFVNVVPVNNPVLGIAKAVSNIKEMPDHSFNVTYVITVENLGNDVISNIQVTDDLSIIFTWPVTYSIVDPPNTNGNLTPNTFYDGRNDINLLESNTSYLDIDMSTTISFTVNIVISGARQTFCNSAAVTGLSSLGIIVSDISDLGYTSDANSNGRPDDEDESDCTPVTITPYDVRIPEAFSPDGDGINDLLVISGIEEYPDNKLSIFNRWGNIVYLMERYDNTWDGKPNENVLLMGKNILPQGTYYYIFEHNKDNREPRTGFIVIKY
ncbi:MAG: HYR domain-containing protein [Bacteroidales bacterium]|nr:HYR domain-containing protein [Bacteroidales bacterium]